MFPINSMFIFFLYSFISHHPRGVYEGKFVHRSRPETVPYYTKRCTRARVCAQLESVALSHMRAQVQQVLTISTGNAAPSCERRSICGHNEGCGVRGPKALSCPLYPTIGCCQVSRMADLSRRGPPSPLNNTSSLLVTATQRFCFNCDTWNGNSLLISDSHATATVP